MEGQSIIFSLFLIFVGCAVTAALALWARQALIVGYIVLGVLLGPWGLGWVDDTNLLADIAKIGIIFLLFMLGLNLAPQKLLSLLKQTTIVTLITSISFSLFGGILALAFGFVWADALIIGFATMFSSTIIGLKLLPTTTLHHQHTGQIIISVLLLQDLFAILVMLVIQGYGQGDNQILGVARQLLALPLLVAIAYVLERWAIEPLLRRFDQIQEYIFLLVIAWCLGIAQLAAALGLSHEIGAFIAGVALASCPASMFIADSLRPLRDFFLILFFFSLGASFDPSMMRQILVPGCLLAAAMLLAKPAVFKVLLIRAGERRRVSGEIGVRLGQISEFSLLIAVLAFESGIIGAQASYVIQLATLITFIASSYWIVMRHPTPIAVRDSLRRD